MSERFTVSELDHRLDGHFDLFVCASSFEERSLVLPLHLTPDRVTQAVIFSDTERSGQAGTTHASCITSHFGAKAKHVELRLGDPLSIADQMLMTLGERTQAPQRILVDITTFSHEALLILLKVLQLTGMHDDVVTGLYTSASEYSTDLTGDAKWLSRGVKEIRSVLGFAGEMRPAQSRHLIVLAGFEADRAEELIKACEPTLLSIGFGSQLTSIAESHHRLNRDFYQKIVANHANARTFEFACDDIQAALEKVQEQAQSVAGYNTVVAPLNTKISTLGVGLAALLDDSLQICYAEPIEYNAKHYSTPSGDMYIFRIDVPMAPTA